MELDDLNVEQNPNFRRGMWVLENKISTVEDLFRLWIFSGPVKEIVPWPEETKPWYEGFKGMFRYYA